MILNSNMTLKSVSIILRVINAKITRIARPYSSSADALGYRSRIIHHTSKEKVVIIQNMTPKLCIHFL